MKKRLAMLALAGVMTVTALSGCTKLKDSDVVATVDAEDITADVANFYARYTQAQYETYMSGYMGEDMWSGAGEDGKTYEETVKEDILTDLENMYLLEDHMKDYEITLSDEEKKKIEDAAADFDEVNGLEEKEKVSGARKTVSRVLTLLTIQQKVKTAIEATVDTEVSDDEAKQKKMQYVTFSFTKEDESGASTDLTDDEKAELKKSAEEFAEGAKSAADFAAYATEKELTSQDATFDAENTSLPTDLVKAADALGEGETTGVVTGTSGYYVAKVTSLFDKDATEQKKTEIVSERKQDQYDKTLEDWRKDVKIKENKKVWKKVDFNKLSVSMKQDDTEPYADEVKTDDQAEQTGE